jgi:acyl-coenzyme A synthetase/AMP-(fatty) acid ligase
MYLQMLAEVPSAASWLRSQGMHKGDALAIYMPMT